MIPGLDSQTLFELHGYRVDFRAGPYPRLDLWRMGGRYIFHLDELASEIDRAEKYLAVLKQAQTVIQIGELK